MVIKLTRVLRNLKGVELEISYPTLEQINALPKIKQQITNKETGEVADVEVPDRSKLPRDTVKNCLLDCLAYYQTVDKKEMFKIYALATKIQESNEEQLEVDDMYRDLLIKTLEYSIAFSEEGKEPHGIYQHWAIAQVFDACGLAEVEIK